MSIFGRRRNFERQMQDRVENPDLTNYEEKKVFAADGGMSPIPDYGTFGTSDFSGINTSADHSQPSAPAMTEMHPIPTASVQTEMRPMVFAMKGHSDIYVYEYPDRLEYYVKASTKMHLFDTVYKNR